MKDVWHQFQAKIPHHEYEEVEVDMDWSRSDDCAKIGIKVEDGTKNRVTLTLDELRAIVALGEKFEMTHKTMTGELK